MPAPQPFAAVPTQVRQLIAIVPAAVGANTTAAQTFTITAAVPGLQLDPVAHQFLNVSQLAWVNGVQTAQPAGILITMAWVPAIGQVSVVFQNTTAGSLTPLTGSYELIVL